MTNESNSIVERLGWREGLMATFVSEDPETRGEQALEECVDCPQETTSDLRRNVFRGQEQVEKGEDGSEEGDITDDIR